MGSGQLNHMKIKIQSIILSVLILIPILNLTLIDNARGFKLSLDNNLSNVDASFIGEHEEDHFGDSVAIVGDVNGDGYDDILVGAHWNDDGGTGAGQIYLIFGKASGWNMDTDLSNADASFLGEDEYDGAGSSIAGAGDVNGDGYDDLFIGAPESSDNRTSCGKTYLIFGKSSDWFIDTPLSNADVIFFGAEGDFSGRSVSGAGDVNGDGYDDILIGATWSDYDGKTHESYIGRTFLIFGKPTGWKSNFSLSEADASFLGEKEEAYSGYSISGVGDINGDGYDDILISARNWIDMEYDEGKAYLIFGKAFGWTMDVNLSQADVSFLTEKIDIGTGHWVAGAGDVNGDGFNDILIGAPADDLLGNYTGKGYLIFGKSTGWAKEINLSNADASFIGERTSSFCGSPITGAGDINGDGYDDILIGCSSADESAPGSGQTYLILGKSTGWGKDLNLSRADASFLGEFKDDWSGSSIAGGGDLNGDGFDDILIGAYKNSEGGYRAGQVYCIFGGNHKQTEGDTYLSNVWTLYLILIVIFIMAVVLLIRGVKGVQVK